MSKYYEIVIFTAGMQDVSLLVLLTTNFSMLIGYLMILIKRVISPIDFTGNTLNKEVMSLLRYL